MSISNETDLIHENLTMANERMFNYMQSWRGLRVGVVLKAYSKHATTGSFVAIAVVWRRGVPDAPHPDGIPVVKRAFDVGLRNHDNSHAEDIRILMEWLADEQNKGTLKSNVALGTASLVSPVPKDLPKPLPTPTDEPVLPPQGLEQHFTVPISAGELGYGCQLGSDVEVQIPKTPPLQLNLFDIVVVLNDFDTDWNTRRDWSVSEV